MQIKTRLTLRFIAISAFLLLSSFILIYYSFGNHLQTEYYKTLQSKALMTVSMLVKNNPELKIEKDENTSNEDILPSKENIIVYNTDFEKLFTFHNENPIQVNILDQIKRKGEYRFNIGSFDAIGIRYQTNLGKDLIIIAKGVFMSEELIRLGNILIITFFLFLFAIAAGGYFFAGQALRPITVTMNEMDKILPSDLSKRLNVSNNKDEISRLALTFNKLLDRIEDAFNIQKGFLSNVSHELRNPIGAIIASIQVNLSKNRTEAEYRKCLQSVLEVAIDLEHTSTHLMELARISSNTDKVLFGPLRLDEIVWQSKASVKNWNQEYNFKFDTSDFPEISDQLIINGNEALLKTAFINLLENACKFSPDHIGYVRVYMKGKNMPAVEIKDTANIIPDEEREQLFKPFYRSIAANKIKGSGIGLSLVASILKMHKAELKISNYENKGNIFTIYFDPSTAKSN
jgi:signal transduction histidine kinase